MAFRHAMLAVAVCVFAVSASAVLTLPPDITAEATGPHGAVVTYHAGVEGGGDDENGRPLEKATCAPASGSTFPIGTTTVNCTGSNGGSGSFQVTVRDTRGPELHLPRDFSVPASSASGATVTWSASAQDAVDGAVGVSCSPASGSFFPVGQTTVQCAAADSRNNNSAGSFVVTVIAQPPPPPPPVNDITAEATGPNGAVVTFNAGGGPGDQDDENGRPIATCTPPSGSVFPLGETTVQCSNGATFKVKVVDTTAPALSLPGNITTPNPTVTYSATATDLVDGSVAVACTPPSGSTFPAGTTTVSCSASDTRGNSASGSFTVTVQQTPPPVNDITAEATGPNGAIVTFNVGGPGDQDDENGRPRGSVSCTPPSGSLFPLGETTVQCSNGVTFKVKVVDTTAPALSLPADITTQNSTVTYTATANDIVDGSVAVTCTPPSGSTFPTGTTTVNCSASDTRGNSASGSFTVTVEEPPPPQDTEAPVITSITASPDELKPPNGKLVTVTIAASVTDNMDDSPFVGVFDVTANEAITDDDWNILGPLSVELRAERDPQGTGRVYTVWLEAIDDAGNRSVSTVTVTVPHDQSAEDGTAAPAQKKAKGLRISG